MEPTTCESAVREFLASYPDFVRLPEAAVLMASAKIVDDPKNSATSRSMMVGRYLESLAALRALLPEDHEETDLDRIRARRAAAAAGQPGA